MEYLPFFLFISLELRCRIGFGSAFVTNPMTHSTGFLTQPRGYIYPLCPPPETDLFLFLTSHIDSGSGGTNPHIHFLHLHQVLPILSCSCTGTSYPFVLDSHKPLTLVLDAHKPPIPPPWMHRNLQSLRAGCTQTSNPSCSIHTNLQSFRLDAFKLPILSCSMHTNVTSIPCL